MRLAIPSDAPGGLDAAISSHFGHADAYTLIDLDGADIAMVRVLPNDESHEGCAAPAAMLQEQGVQAVLAGGMGGGSQAAFAQAGIPVLHAAAAPTVREAVALFLQGALPPMGVEQGCGGGGGGGCGGCGGGGGGHGHDHGHHHAPVVRPPIEGEPRVQADRVVSVAYILRDGEGRVLGSSAGGGPLTYLHGRHMMVPGFERAVEGRLPGERLEVAVPPADGYGEVDPGAVFEVSREQVPGDLEVGRVVHARAQGGGLLQLTIVALTEEIVRLDANHPLAGKTLHFEVEILAVQAATPEELAHGHVH